MKRWAFDGEMLGTRWISRETVALKSELSRSYGLRQKFNDRPQCIAETHLKQRVALFEDKCLGQTSRISHMWDTFQEVL